MSKPVKDPHSKSAINYAKRVIGGKIPACWQVKAACQRFLDDFKRKDIEYREDLAAHACQFIEALPHVAGPLSGELIKMEPFQLILVCNLFGWTDKETGLRRFREAFVLLPRGSGKSTLAAPIALYMSFAQGQGGAEGLCGATSKKQAEAVFGPARRMVLETPALATALGLEVAKSSIYQESTGSSLQMVIAKTKDGGLPWVAIADELHEALDETQLAAFRTGMGKRRGADPLLIIISTAGTNVAGVCRQEQLYFEGVLKGTIKDDSKFALIYTIDETDDWRDFEVWKKANPGYGVSVDEKHLRSEYAKALQSPSAQAMALTKYLNVWQNTASGWLNKNDWKKGARADLKISGAVRCYIGVDLSTKTDITAVSLVAEMEDGTIAVQPYLFLPEGALERSKNAKAYREWIAKGDLIRTDGEASDHEEVEAMIRKLCAEFSVQEVLFDSWQAAGMIQRLQKEGLKCAEFGQTPRNFTGPMTDFEADLMNGKIVHPDNACLNWMAANASVRQMGILKSLCKPTGQDHMKIDGIAATLMAYSQTVKVEEEAQVPTLFFV